jgi:hypothetical protein
LHEGVEEKSDTIDIFIIRLGRMTAADRHSGSSGPLMRGCGALGLRVVAAGSLALPSTGYQQPGNPAAGVSTDRRVPTLQYFQNQQTNHEPYFMPPDAIAVCHAQ